MFNPPKHREEELTASTRERVREKEREREEEQTEGGRRERVFLYLYVICERTCMYKQTVSVCVFWVEEEKMFLPPVSCNKPAHDLVCVRVYA